MDSEKLVNALSVVMDVRRILTGVDEASAGESLVQTIGKDAEDLILLQHAGIGDHLQFTAGALEAASASLLQAVIDAKEAAGLQ